MEPGNTFPLSPTPLREIGVAFAGRTVRREQRGHEDRPAAGNRPRTCSPAAWRARSAATRCAVTPPPEPLRRPFRARKFSTSQARYPLPCDQRALASAAPAVRSVPTSSIRTGVAPSGRRLEGLAGATGTQRRVTISWCGRIWRLGGRPAAEPTRRRPPTCGHRMSPGLICSAACSRWAFWRAIPQAGARGRTSTTAEQRSALRAGDAGIHA